MTASAKYKTQAASGRKSGVMGERGIWDLLKTAAEVVGPPRMSDVGLLSNRKIVQIEGLWRQGHRTGITAENSVEGCVQGSYAVRDKRLSEELRGPQLGQGRNMLCRRLLRHRILGKTLAAGERIEGPLGAPVLSGAPNSRDAHHGLDRRAGTHSLLCPLGSMCELHTL